MVQRNPFSKFFSFLAVLSVFGMGMVASSFATGVVSDKDTIENRGAGNLDVPMEKLPKASPKPTPDASPMAQPKSDPGKK